MRCFQPRWGGLTTWSLIVFLLAVSYAIHFKAAEAAFASFPPELLVALIYPLATGVVTFLVTMFLIVFYVCLRSPQNHTQPPEPCLVGLGSIVTFEYAKHPWAEVAWRYALLNTGVQWFRYHYVLGWQLLLPPQAAPKIGLKW
jgi:hypothetical protein